MADQITINGVPPYDGSYEVDLDGRKLTTREWGWIKRYAGYQSPLDMGDNSFTDPEVVSVVAIVALYRNGKISVPDIPALWDRFQDAPFGDTITFKGGPVEEDDDDGPPPGNSGARPSSNGDNSTTSSETSETNPSPTGPPRSATSGSVPVTSAT